MAPMSALPARMSTASGGPAIAPAPKASAIAPTGASFVASAKARSLALKAKTPDMKTEDRYERMAGPFHRRLRRGFLDIAKHEPERCRVIEANGSIDEVAAKVWAAVSEKFALTEPAV